MTLYECVSFLEVCRHPEFGSNSILLDTGSPYENNRAAIHITLTTIFIALNI